MDAGVADGERLFLQRTVPCSAYGRITSITEKAKAGLFLDSRQAMGLVQDGTTVRALWIRRAPWLGKSEYVPCWLPEMPDSEVFRFAEGLEKLPCVVFMLCRECLNTWKEPLFWSPSSPTLSWVYKELSIKCEQTMTEHPFYEAEILMLGCLYFPYDVLPRSVSSVFTVP